MKTPQVLAPVMEGLEPRLLLSGSGLEAAALAAGKLQWLAAGGPAAYTSRPARDFWRADAWQHAGVQRGRAASAKTVLPQSPVGDSPAPGWRVTGQIANYAGSQYLYIVGTNGDDAITISQASSSVTVSTAQGTLTFSGTFGSIGVYGYGGSDTVRVAYSVTGNVTVYGGDGSDTVYDAGRGNDSLYGEGGSDTLISIGGGADQVYGGDGTDSFWTDGNDPISDASLAETAAGNVHRVYQFYGNVSMEIQGQALADPALGRYASGYANFASHPLFTDGPTYTDIRQGALGDCYFLASLASIADTNPDAIRQMITPLGDGTYAVRFFRNGSAVYLRLDADLPVGGGSGPVYAGFSASGELWVPIAEKAYAFFRTSTNSYPSIEGGWMGAVCTEVTNRGTVNVATSATDSQLVAAINAALSAGQAVTAGTKSTASGPVVGSHAYMVKSTYIADGQTYVVLYNPWGVDGTRSDSNPNDGLVTLTLSVFKQNFTAAVAIV
jgi:hypothetical protein